MGRRTVTKPTMKPCSRCANPIAYDGADTCGDCGSCDYKKIEKLSVPSNIKDDIVTLANKINEIIERIEGE